MLHPLAILVALAGLGLALAAFLAEGTGVDGSAGALLAVIGAGAMLAGLLLMRAVRPGVLRGVLAALTVLAAGLTALAGWFLMQTALAAVMALATLVALAVALTPRRTRRI